MKLSDELESFRCDRPSEWKMDDFILKTKALESSILKANEQAEFFEREMYLLEDVNDKITENTDAIQLEFNKFQTEISRAVGSCDFMDIPDGGSVTLPEQVSRMREQHDKYKGQLLEVLSLIYSSAVGEVCMGYNSNIESIAQSAFEITGISEPETRRKFEPLSD